MPTQEERLITLEQTITEYRPVLRDIVHELAIVKGLTISQVKITQELRQDISDINKHLDLIDEHLDTMDTRFDTMDTHFDTMDTRLNRLEVKSDEHTTLLNEHTALLIQILERLPKTP